MTPATLLTTGRTLSRTTSSQISDDQALIYLNLRKNDLWSAIVTAVGENRNWDKWKADTVAEQSEYTQPIMSSSTVGTKTINAIAINYDGETYDGNGALIYIPAKEISPESLPHEWNYYVNNQSKENPIFYVAENSIFIAPAPETTVTNGIKIEGIKSISDYSISTSEADMVIPFDQHETLLQGLVAYMFQDQQQQQEYINAVQIYESMKINTTKVMSDRVQKPYYAGYNDGSESQNVTDFLHGSN